MRQIDASTELCNRVVESARVAARRREALVAEQVKLSEEQVFDMRGCFSEMTHSGVIGPDDLHYLLVELFPDHEIDDAFVQELLDLALPSGYFHSSSKSSSSAPRAAKPSESNPSKSKAAQASISCVVRERCDKMWLSVARGARRRSSGSSKGISVALHAFHVTSSASSITATSYAM